MLENIFSAKKTINDHLENNTEDNTEDNWIATDKPYLFIAGHLAGANKKDTIQYVRNLMETTCSSLDESSYSVMAYMGGFAYEIHEGGAKKAYLPWIIEELASAANGVIAFQIATHIISIEKSSSGFITLFIPDGGEYKNALLEATGIGYLTSYTIDRTKYVATAIRMFSCSCLILFLVIITKASTVLMNKDDDVDLLTQKTRQLPILSWPKNSITKGAYINKLSYVNDAWQAPVLLSPKNSPAEEINQVDIGNKEMNTIPMPIPPANDPAAIEKGLTGVPTIVDGKVVIRPINTSSKPQQPLVGRENSALIKK